MKQICKNCLHLIQQLLNPFSYAHYSISHVRVYRVDVLVPFKQSGGNRLVYAQDWTNWGHLSIKLWWLDLLYTSYAWGREPRRGIWWSLMTTWLLFLRWIWCYAGCVFKLKVLYWMQISYYGEFFAEMWVLFRVRHIEIGFKSKKAIAIAGKVFFCEPSAGQAIARPKWVRICMFTGNTYGSIFITDLYLRGDILV